MEYPKIKFEKYNPDNRKLNGMEFTTLFVDELKSIMDFKKFREVFDKRCGVIVIDELAQIKPKLKVSINPTRESSWVKEFEQWLKDKEDETGI